MAAGLLVVTTLNIQAQDIEFLGGETEGEQNLANDQNWDGGSQPNMMGEVGLINVNAILNIGNTLGQWIAGEPDLIIGGGATITTSGDWGHTVAASSTINDATLIVGDDIFSNDSEMTFNEGSTTTVNDDFEANGLSIINVTGGTHTVNDSFGAQGNSAVQFGTLNFSGGDVTAERFRNDAFGIINLSGTATLSGNDDTSRLLGSFNISDDWSGSWTISGLTGTDWETEVTDEGWTFDGVAVDATVFAENFQVTNDGTTLSLISPNIPPPSTLMLCIAQVGDTLEFEFNSLSGMQYDIVSDIDLSTAPDTWLPYNDGVTTFENIISTGTGIQTISGALLVGPTRFFALIENEIPPPLPLLEEDFESSDGGFTFVSAAGTDWAHGNPDSSGPGGDVNEGNGGSVNCWGTDIGNPGFYLDPTTNSCLRSTVIDLTEVTGAELTFAQALDLPAADSVTVNIIDDTTDTVIATDIISITDTDTLTAFWEPVGPIALPDAALGQLVRIEWCLSGEAGPSDDFLGWYIDDVVVTPTTP